MWQVDVLGTPRASPTDTSDCATGIKLRSQQTWALLASLLLEPEKVSREVLAARFWPDLENQRKSLRSAVESIRKAFGDDAVVAGRDELRLDLSRFKTDYGRLSDLLTEAKSGGDDYRRRSRLLEAATLIRGRFLEGKDLFDDSDGFLELWRGRCAALAARTCAGLAAAHEALGDSAATFDALADALRHDPQDGTAARNLVRVGNATGRERVAEQFLSDLGADDLAHTPRPTTGLTDSVSPALSAVLSSLSVFPGGVPFPPDWAHIVDRGADAATLDILVRAGRLRRETVTVCGESQAWYALGGTSRARLGNSLPGRQRGHLEDRYVRCAQRLMSALYSDATHPAGEGGQYAPFVPHLEAVARIIIRRPPDEARLTFVSELHHGGFVTQALLLREWTERAAGELSLAEETRTQAACTAGKLATSAKDFRAASVWLSRALGPNGFREHAAAVVQNMHLLSIADHHAARYEAAMARAREAYQFAETLGDDNLVADAAFAVAETTYSTGFRDEALAASERCVTLRRRMGKAAILAVALYQNGVVRYAAGDGAGAVTVLNEAMERFFEGGEQNGVADCLRQLAVIRLAAGALGEALAFATQAQAIYRGRNEDASHAAVLEILGDIRRAQGNAAAARPLYGQSLAHWESVGHPRWTERLKARLADLDAGDTSSNGAPSRPVGTKSFRTGGGSSNVNATSLPLRERENDRG